MVDLEMDELNQHECMATMTALIGHMQRNNITPKVEQVSGTEKGQSTEINKITWNIFCHQNDHLWIWMLTVLCSQGFFFVYETGKHVEWTSSMDEISTWKTCKSSNTSEYQTLHLKAAHQHRGGEWFHMLSVTIQFLTNKYDDTMSPCTFTFWTLRLLRCFDHMPSTGWGRSCSSLSLETMEERGSISWWWISWSQCSLGQVWPVPRL